MKKFKVSLAVILFTSSSLIGVAPLSAAQVTKEEIPRITVHETGDGTVVEGMVKGNPNERLLAFGEHTQYPSQGGKWTYGFWNAKVRSYYTVNKHHGSTVVYNGKTARSIKTAPGKKSIAEKYAINLPGNDDRYYYRIY